MVCDTAVLWHAGGGGSAGQGRLKGQGALGDRCGLKRWDKKVTVMHARAVREVAATYTCSRNVYEYPWLTTPVVARSTQQPGVLVVARSSQQSGVTKRLNTFNSDRLIGICRPHKDTFESSDSDD